MRPMGMKPSRFPGKRDVHPPAGYANWWEVEIENREDKKAERQRAKRECRESAEIDVDNAVAVR